MNQSCLETKVEILLNRLNFYYYSNRKIWCFILCQKYLPLSKYQGYGVFKTFIYFDFTNSILCTTGPFYTMSFLSPSQHIDSPMTPISIYSRF